MPYIDNCPVIAAFLVVTFIIFVHKLVDSHTSWEGGIDNSADKYLFCWDHHICMAAKACFPDRDEGLEYCGLTMRKW